MATKKTATKKTATKKLPPVLPFTKANALALADDIYLDKGGRVSFLKLCGNELSNGKDGGRTLHCAVGEAYFSFVSRDMKRVLNTDDEYVPEAINISTEGSTGKVIEELVAKAVLKNNKPETRQALAHALESAVSANDDVCDGDASEYEERASEVARVFRTQVAPLLK